MIVINSKMEDFLSHTNWNFQEEREKKKERKIDDIT